MYITNVYYKKRLMPLPYFYLPFIDNAESLITLDEETSKHIVSVLRMHAGDRIHLTNGKGTLLTGEITDDHKRMCVVRIVENVNIAPSPKSLTIAISLLKNGSRFEWFVEKAAEIGVTEIFPVICERSEKLHFRYDRKVNILVSAMLQSQQAWLPVLREPKKIDELLPQVQHQQRFIAHCLDEAKKPLITAIDPSASSQVIFIGPEGDFTKAEIDLALQHNCVPVTLGETRLRSETAGIVAAAILKNVTP
jgi:16S rRNA (uracil1498-N3)-methyltransferase